MGNIDGKFSEAKAYAKVNLVLDITGVGDNGYHFIDTVMEEADICDIITARTRLDKSVNVRYKGGISFAKDNALAAAEAFVKKYDTCGADFYIEKNIPLGAGLGGSSADSAGVVKLLSKFYDITPDNDFLYSLGADVPFMYRGGAKRVTGFGETVGEVKLPAHTLVIAYIPGLRAETPKVFAEYDRLGGDKQYPDEFLKDFNNCGNALEKAAVNLYPVMGEIKSAMKKSGFKNVTMSGSGSAFVAYGEDENEINKALFKLNKMRRDIVTLKYTRE